MTDGIIQEVFRKYTGLIDKNRYTISWYELKDLQQELIEKIKQNKIHVRFSMDAILLKTLIGDNQE